MKLTHTKLTATLIASVSAGALCAPAFGQGADGAEDNDRRLGTVTVTAEKQETNLQETPIAITAIDEETLELQGVVDATDISGFAPNLTVNPGILSPSSAVIGIRGIPNPSDEALTLDTPIGMYIDGVFVARSAGSAIAVADIAQVEVLRGPQGTLFGRNTTGGAVNFITKRPTEESSLSLEGSYGNFNYRKAKITGNSGALSNGLKLFGTVSYTARDGHQDNLLADDDQDPGAYETTAGRIGVEFSPTPSSNVYYTFDYADSEFFAPAFQTTIVSPTVAGFLANSTTNAGCNLTVSSGRLEDLCLNDQEGVENTTWGHTLKFENDFGPVLLRSTTGVRSWENTIPNSDIDGFGDIIGPEFSQATLFNGLPSALTSFIFPDPNPATPVNETALFVETLPVPTNTFSLFSSDNVREQDQWSQEFELIDNQKDDNFDWVLGAYFFHEESSENNNQFAGFVLDTNAILGAIPGLGAGLAAANQPQNQFRALNAPSQVIYDTESDSYAIYGQGTYRPAGPDGALGLTVGLRHTWDEKSINQTQGIVNADDLEDSALTGHFTLDYRFNPDVNGYAKYARGYKSGGFNTRSVQEPFEAEFLDSYELGLKTELADGTVRLNGAVFFAQYTDQQITQPIAGPPGTGFQTVIVNAGEREYTGIEIEALAKPTDALTLNASLGYVDIETKEFPFQEADGSITNIADEVLQGTTPDTTLNVGAAYEWNLSNGNLIARINGVHETERTFFSLERTSPLATQLTADSRTLVDAQLRWDNISINGSQTNAYVMLWAKNLFDEEYEVRAIDFGPLGYGGFVYGDPATFGIDVGVTF